MTLKNLLLGFSTTKKALLSNFRCNNVTNHFTIRKFNLTVNFANDFVMPNKSTKHFNFMLLPGLCYVCFGINNLRYREFLV